MRRQSLLLAILMPIVAFTACSDTATEPEASVADIIKQATDAYQSFAAAQDDGFVPLSECVASPAGGMGFHYGLPARIEDAVIDPALPEVLLYEPAAGGEMRLVGVEFMVHEDAWTGAGHTSPPSLDGQPFDAPDPDHPDVHLREFHMLHAWVWKENPSGMFMPFNPDVTCD